MLEKGKWYVSNWTVEDRIEKAMAGAQALKLEWLDENDEPVQSKVFPLVWCQDEDGDEVLVVTVVEEGKPWWTEDILIDRITDSMLLEETFDPSNVEVDVLSILETCEEEDNMVIMSLADFDSNGIELGSGECDGNCCSCGADDTVDLVDNETDDMIEPPTICDCCGQEIF